MSGRAVRAALLSEKGWSEAQVPAVRTMTSLRNRLGYRLRRVTKTRPEKNGRVRGHLRQRRRAAAGN